MQDAAYTTKVAVEVCKVACDASACTAVVARGKSARLLWDGCLVVMMKVGGTVVAATRLAS
jgi:hypothetical protein